MSKDDDRTILLRASARTHGGVVPVPFLGTTWWARRAAYWWRRAGVVLLFLLFTGLVGGLAIGFTIGIAGDGHSTAQDVVAVLYGLTAVLGVRTALRMIAQAPLTGRPGAPRSHLPNGLLALMMAPFGAGLIITFLVAAFGRDFIGERDAREATAALAPRAREATVSRRAENAGRARRKP